LSTISKVRGRQVYNSRGEPTVEVEVWVDGVRGVAAAPSGASVGRHEAISYPEGGVDGALEVLRLVDSRLRGFDASNPEGLTEELTKRIMASDPHLIKGDPRRTEPKKPGGQGARRKRQNSYR
jgi:enolase